MPVGDIKSSERGSGARYNDGKLDVLQISIRLWGAILNSSCLKELATFEDRCGFDPESLLTALYSLGPKEDVLKEAIEVFNYGQKKYARYNWMKGMKWTIPLACIVRHEFKVFGGELNDQESGLPHRGHIACNLIMLMHYLENYPEGDDRREATQPMTFGIPNGPIPLKAPQCYTGIDMLAGNAPLPSVCGMSHPENKPPPWFVKTYTEHLEKEAGEKIRKALEWQLGDWACVTLSFSQYCGRNGKVIGLFGDETGAKSLTIKFDNGNQDVFGTNEVLHASPGEPIGKNPGHGVAGGGGDVHGPGFTGVAGHIGGSVQAGGGAPLDTVQARHPEGPEL